MNQLEIPDIDFTDLCERDKFYKFKLFFAKQDYQSEGGMINLEEFDYVNFQTYKASTKDYKDSKGYASKGLCFSPDKIIKYKFHDDYLIPAIEKMEENLLGKIESRRIKELKYSTSEMMGFYSQIENEFIDLITKFQKATFLHDNVKEIVYDIINTNRDTLLDLLENLKSNEVTRIPFNLSRENLAFLFSQLHRNSEIVGISLQDLGRLMARYISTQGKPITQSFRNRLTYYSNTDNWTEKNKSELIDILTKLSPK